MVRKIGPVLWCATRAAPDCRRRRRRLHHHHHQCRPNKPNPDSMSIGTSRSRDKSLNQLHLLQARPTPSSLPDDDNDDDENENDQRDSMATSLPMLSCHWVAWLRLIDDEKCDQTKNEPSRQSSSGREDGRAIVLCFVGCN